MDEVMAPCLQVNALASGIGAAQDAQRLFRRVRIEGKLHLFAPILPGDAR
jgi:hypothetical protein